MDHTKADYVARIGLGLLAFALAGGCIAGGDGDALEGTDDKSVPSQEPGGDATPPRDSSSAPAPAAPVTTAMGADSVQQIVGSVPSSGPQGPPGSAGAGGFSMSPGANTNVSLGGAQDFGFFRSQLEAGVVPRPGTFDAAGFFAEHHTALPEPSCGERVCVQAMLGVLGNLMRGTNCTMLQLGLNSPLAANPDDRPPLSLAVVVDVSGSMEAGDKIGFVRNGLELLIDGMRDEDMLAIITYSDRVSVPFPMQNVSMKRAEARSIVQGLTAGGSTNLNGGLETGYKEVLGLYDSARQNRVILLSDGLPTAGITGEVQIMDMSRAYNSDGVGLSTVGLGTDFNTELMRGLAELGDGNTYFLENAGAVSEVFTEELSYFTVPVAFDLELKVSTGQHYRLNEAYGSSFWEDTTEGGVLEVPSVFLAHRESADDVTADGGRRGGGSALMLELQPLDDEVEGVSDVVVATVDVSFREPGTDETITDSVEVRFPMSPWVTPERGFFDSPDIPIIQKSFVMLNIYVAFEMAVGSYYSNEPEASITVLEQVTAGVEDYNEEIQDMDMDYDLLMLNDLRNLIASEINPPEVRIVEDPWPCD